MATAYTCPWHNIEIERGQHCEACIDRYATLPDPAGMTDEERIAELNDWYDRKILTISMGDLQQRFEALVGRPVWTHELVNREALVREIEIMATEIDQPLHIHCDEHITRLETENEGLLAVLKDIEERMGVFGAVEESEAKDIRSILRTVTER